MQNQSSVFASDRVREISAALQANRALQAELGAQLSRIEVALACNAEKKRLLEQHWSRKSGFALDRHDVFAAPLVVGSKGDQPTPNSDVAIVRSRSSHVHQYHRSKKWSVVDSRKLRNAVKLQQDRRVLSRHLSQSSSTADSTADIDFYSISTSVFRSHRTAAELKARWLNCEDPRLSTRQWSDAETKRLVELAEQHGGRQWFDIARQLNTFRSPFQCFAQYQRHCSPPNHVWTAQEDARLCELVLRLGSHNNWRQIASEMNGRTHKQCLIRYARTLDPQLKTGAWDLEEDARLWVAVQSCFRNQWATVARFVPGRSDLQCRDRWTNTLDPTVARSDQAWSDAESSMLKQCVAERPGWSNVARAMHEAGYHRTDRACLQQYTRLCPDLVDKRLSRKRTAPLAAPTDEPQTRPHAVGRIQSYGQLNIAPPAVVASAPATAPASAPATEPASVPAEPFNNRRSIARLEKSRARLEQSNVRLVIRSVVSRPTSSGI